MLQYTVHQHSTSLLEVSVADKHCDCQGSHTHCCHHHWLAGGKATAAAALGLLLCWREGENSVHNV